MSIKSQYIADTHVPQLDQPRNEFPSPRIALKGDLSLGLRGNISVVSSLLILASSSILLSLVTTDFPGAIISFCVFSWAGFLDALDRRVELPLLIMSSKWSFLRWQNLLDQIKILITHDKTVILLSSKNKNSMICYKPLPKRFHCSLFFICSRLFLRGPSRFDSKMYIYQMRLNIICV